MSTRTGFPRMDWDTGFLADPKFQYLRDLLPDPVTFGYAGFCYLRLVADAWRTCERRAVTTAVRGITSETVQALEESGLLKDGLLAESAFDQWVGSAMKRREDEAVRRARSRASAGQPPRPAVSAGVHSALGSDGRDGAVVPVDRDGSAGGAGGTNRTPARLAADHIDGRHTFMPVDGCPKCQSLSVSLS